MNAEFPGPSITDEHTKADLNCRSVKPSLPLVLVGVGWLSFLYNTSLPKTILCIQHEDETGMKWSLHIKNQYRILVSDLDHLQNTTYNTLPPTI